MINSLFSRTIVEAVDFMTVAAVEDVEVVDFIVVAAVEEVEAFVKVFATGTFLAFLAVVEADGFIVVAAGEDVEAEVAAHCAFVAVWAVKVGR